MNTRRANGWSCSTALCAGVLAAAQASCLGPPPALVTDGSLDDPSSADVDARVPDAGGLADVTNGDDTTTPNANATDGTAPSLDAPASGAEAGLDGGSGLGCRSDELACGNACVPNDPRNCGSCGHDCTDLVNVVGAVGCSQGRCTFDASACKSGFAHCDGGPDLGCESTISTAAQCGACGNACTSTTPVCAGSGLTYACNSGCPTATPSLCSTSCTDKATDALNCGKCGNVCTTNVTHAQGVCSSGTCSYQCTASYPSDCAGGCTSYQNDNNNCGGCGASFACSGGKTCQSGKCACTGTKTDCGSCVDLSGDPKNCGACSHDCLGGSCIGGQCQPIALGGDSTSGDVPAYAIDSGNLYWAQLSTSTIERCPTATGCPAGATPFFTGSAASFVAFIAFDATNVYWDNLTLSTGVATIYKCAKAGCSNPSTFYAGTSTKIPRQLRTDSSSLYWELYDSNQDASYIDKCPFAGCPSAGPSLVLQSLGSSTAYGLGPGFLYAGVTSSAADGGSVNTIYRCSVNGCSYTPTPLVSMPAVATDGLGNVNADTANVYWSDSRAQATYQCPVSGCATPTVLSSQHDARGLAIDSSYVYWATSVGEIVRCAIGGCGDNPTPLAQGLATPGLVGMDSTALYFYVVDGSTGAATFMKLAK